MAGIELYGAYVPLRRLGQGTQGWRSPNEKAVAFYDEDSITMAVAAVIDCLSTKGAHAFDRNLPFRKIFMGARLFCSCPPEIF